MEVAVFLLLLVLAELVCTVFCVTRCWHMMRDVKVLQDTVAYQGRLIADVAGDAAASVPCPEPDVDFADLLSKATPQDMEAAAKVIAALGLDKA